jgi:hypothetical protein
MFNPADRKPCVKPLTPQNKSTTLPNVIPFLEVIFLLVGYCRGFANALRKREMVSCNHCLLTNIETLKSQCIRPKCPLSLEDARQARATARYNKNARPEEIRSS